MRPIEAEADFFKGSQGKILVATSAPAWCHLFSFQLAVVAEKRNAEKHTSIHKIYSSLCGSRKGM
jgi:hypothetical protein